MLKSSFFSGKQILIAGGTGLIGSHLSNKLEFKAFLYPKILKPNIDWKIISKDIREIQKTVEIKKYLKLIRLLSIKMQRNIKNK